MIANRQSGAGAENSALIYVPRKNSREKNTQWFRRAITDQKPDGRLVLIGGTGLTDFRLRVAQSHVRHDFRPSLWSHIALIGKTPDGSSADWPLYEVSLNPKKGFGSVPECNGVQEGRLSDYDNPSHYPNIACVDFGVNPCALFPAVDAFKRNRSLVDVASLIVEWLSFAWGAGDSGNPLLKGAGVPAAAFVEGVYMLADLDLTPGLSSQASCPEAIWQSAKWWHEFYSRDPGPSKQPPRGYFCDSQRAAAVL